ncbi:sulfite exporter TauE/SafE family protein [Pseudomonas inefficax]|jgi:hypothetical protein|nr:sulfite exporter TauE/SafE family protein [Pseudomonas inefficax]WNN40210.1 sulfite exporter TauE/SafE family protein [Pseudomonas inefficax]
MPKLPVEHNPFLRMEEVPQLLSKLRGYHGGHVDWQMGLAMALGGLLSVSWGVRWAYRAPEKTLVRLIFLLFDRKRSALVDSAVNKFTNCESMLH